MARDRQDGPWKPGQGFFCSSAEKRRNVHRLLALHLLDALASDLRNGIRGEVLGVALGILGPGCERE